MRRTDEGESQASPRPLNLGLEAGYSGDGSEAGVEGLIRPDAEFPRLEENEVTGMALFGACVCARLAGPFADAYRLRNCGRRWEVLLNAAVGTSVGRELTDILIQVLLYLTNANRLNINIFLLFLVKLMPKKVIS